MKLEPVTVFKTIVSLALLVFVLTQIDFHQAWTQFQHLSWQFILFALLFYTGCQWLSCLRWSVVLDSSNHSVPMNHLLGSYFAGMFLNIFLPGA
ncbi:MAG: flippase-like domain-containing protein, partial [Leptolyngbyaceae cyanobacterium SU_3_3]|nr:flippase-like domain-containing protein [Leptolyngbyaceae cyanobacterium SU_3_3]